MDTPLFGESPSPSLRVELLGGVRLSFGGRPVEAFAAPRLQALLAFFCLYGGAPRPRREVAERFWPDSGSSQARTNLRRELHKLRQNIPELSRFIDLRGSTLSWRPNAVVSTDMNNFEAALDRAARASSLRQERSAWETAVGVYRGDLVPACDDSWLEEPRERLRQRFRQALERLSSLLEEERDFVAAIIQTQRLLRLDPFHEPAYARLMRLHALQGDRAGALHVYHSCASLLQQELGVAPGQELTAQYSRILAGAGQVPAPGSASRLPFIGRRREWALALRCWHQAAAGEPRLLLIRGEAGIGKTRLAEGLREWAARQGVTSAWSRTYAAEGSLAYAPVSEWLRSDALKAGVGKLDAVWLAHVARLLPELQQERPSLPRIEAVDASWQRRPLFEALARAVLMSPQPLLLILDEVQWCDRETLEWLHFLLRHAGTGALLVACTVRTEDVDDNPALISLSKELDRSGRLTTVDLGPLSEEETEELAGSIAGRGFTTEEQRGLFRETEGHPLFIVETVRAGLRIGDDAASRGQAATPGHRLPPKIRAVVSTRLAQLSAPACELAGLAATVGRSFSFDVLAQASDTGESQLVRALDELWQRRIVREEASRYDFTHDRFREVAYGELSPARRTLFHRRVAQALRVLHEADLDGVSASLAMHYEQGGDATRAQEFYRRAARVAAGVSAHDEAVRLLRQALALQRRDAPSAERDRHELALRQELSVSLTAAPGHASRDLEETLERIRALGEGLRDPKTIVQGLLGLWAVHMVRGNVRRAYRFVRAGLEAVEREGQPALLPHCHFSLAGTLLTLGELSQAESHFQRVRELVDPDKPQPTALGDDLLGFSRAWEAHLHCLRAELDLAASCAATSLARAERLAHPHSQVVAHAYACLTHQLRGDAEAAFAHARRTASLCEKYGIAYYGEWATILHGWLLAEGGDAEGGGEQVRRVLRSLQAQGAGLRRPYYLSLLADAHRRAGRNEEAVAALDAAISTATETGDLWWLPELHRLRGLVSSGEQAQLHFQRALAVAQRQGSRLLERRAVRSLERH